METHRMKVLNTGYVPRIKLDNIPEWLLVEVLIRLPVKLVFRSKLVCKEWLSMISDPYFVSKYISSTSKWPQMQPWTFISGVTEAHGCQHSNPNVKVLADIYTPDLNYPSVYVLSCPYGRKDIIGVSNGLVLCGEHVYGEQCSYYTIWNPVTGQCIALPPLARTYGIFGMGFLTHVENGVLTSYGVVRHNTRNSSGYLIFHVFLSEIGGAGWKDYTTCIRQEVNVSILGESKSLNGILHWITSKHGIVAYDPYHKPDCLRFITLPGDIDLTCKHGRIYFGIPSLFDVHQGRLRYFEIADAFMLPYGFSSFGVWLLNDYSTEDWCLQHRINSADIIFDSILSGNRLFLEPLSFHPFDSDIVYMGYENIIVSCNIKTRKLEAHCSPHVDLSSTKLYYWWRIFFLLMPPWPTSIPPQFSGVAKN